MDGALTILLLPLLLAGLILVILNILDLDISLKADSSYVDGKLSGHESGLTHTNMLHKDHDSSLAAHANFDDKYMSSTGVKTLLTTHNTSSTAHPQLVTVLDNKYASTSAVVGLESSLSGVSSSVTNLDTNLTSLINAYNDHTHSDAVDKPTPFISV